MLVENIKGNFAFVSGIGAFSAGAVARPGFEIVHAALKPLVTLEQGYELVTRHLGELRRPLNALCAMELRIPRALTPQEFDQFNRGYVEKLKSWDILVGDANPVARTNVALAVNPVAAPSLAGFFYTLPSDGAARTFVLAGSAEMKGREGGRPEIVAHGDTSAAGMRLKAEAILDTQGTRLAEMRVSWNDASAVNLYTVHDVHPLLATTILPALDEAGRYGVNWIYARPPVTGLELEIDGHAVRREIILR